MATTAKPYAAEPTALVITLPGGSTILIDERDWEWPFTAYSALGNAYVAQPCDVDWNIHDGNSVRGSIFSGRVTSLNCRLERLLTEAEPGQVVRFKNGNWRDCRRVNLEVR